MILRGRSRVRPGVNVVVAAVVASGLVLASPSVNYAHDIPASVRVFVFIKPAGQNLRVVIRAPLEAMRDVSFPLNGPGYLDIARATPLLGDAARVWLAGDLHLYENDSPLGDGKIVATRVSLPSDRSFTTFDSAVAHATSAPLDTATQLVWNQAMLDVVLDYRIASDSARFSIDPALARLAVRTTTVLRFLPASGGERDFEYLGNPGLVHLDPRWSQAALSFVKLGFEHILSGFDHLLFLLCLVIPFRRVRPLIAIVTAFTVAHSITLIASAAGFAPDSLWFPPLIEVLIAVSIVYMALENIVGAKLERRWLVAFGFGLVHGFGFSFALRESLQFAGSHLATSLVSFNVGVELGQLAVLALTVPALNWFFSHAVKERMGTIILSAFVAHTAWHWMLDRGAVLASYHVDVPELTPALVASLLRGLMFLLVIVTAAWGVFAVYGRLTRGSRDLSAGAEAK
ncbi:MAG TPA: HupE/UreJ family protein [Gemmatimonadaceae bacterium]|nr:HupE/UreJ family protein [Gemmatimonadaceae bacterium]